MKSIAFKISFFASIVLIVTTLLNPTGQNHEVHASNIEEANMTMYEGNSFNFDDYKYEFEAQAGAVAIFFGGIVVGWIIGGAVTYATGYSPDYWVSKGIGHVHNTLRNLPVTANSEVIVYPNGSVQQRCNGSGYCAIPSKIILEDV